MIFLRSVAPKPGVTLPRGFPFEVPLIRSLQALDFDTPVTFLVGENGSGKSTLLEGLAAGTQAIVVGGDDVATDPTLAHARALAPHWRFSWAKRTRRGFFLRAEDFFNFSRRIGRLREELEESGRAFDETLSGYGHQLARGVIDGQKAALARQYGEDLDANSHGESFLKLFQARFVPGGLYLLDEPEAPLSPLRQLTFLSLLKQMVEQNAQFIIATHSPLLLALPGARIYSCDETPPRPVPYDELEHVKLTRDFLRDPNAFLRHL